MNFKYGKQAPRRHPLTLQLNHYLKADVPLLPPAKASWEYQSQIPADWGMYKNNEIGDCTCAALAHMIMCFTANTGKIVIPTDDDVVKAYSAITGYSPVTGLNDNGAVMTDVFDYWKNVGLAGHKIDGWVAIDHTNLDHVKLGLYLFGAINPGIQMPQSAEQQFDTQQPWDIDINDDNTIVGGHSVPFFGFGSQGLTGVTWGKRQPTGWPWWIKYVDELYAPLSLDWIKTNLEAPNHLHMDDLESDLKRIAN